MFSETAGVAFSNMDMGGSGVRGGTCMCTFPLWVLGNWPGLATRPFLKMTRAFNVESSEMMYRLARGKLKIMSRVEVLLKYRIKSMMAKVVVSRPVCSVVRINLEIILSMLPRPMPVVARSSVMREPVMRMSARAAAPNQTLTAIYERIKNRMKWVEKEKKLEQHNLQTHLESLEVGKGSCLDDLDSSPYSTSKRCRTDCNNDDW